ncbi:glutamate receptor ionotropic, delta-1-like [Haliotis asinina]|uniref:glutamate receptor ionotropic, delta-1-like n=1 Tax=Haliotis asinina TaxID=109174 RepID=UPI00353214E0
MDNDAFPSTISSHISTVTLFQNLDCVKQNLKFLVLADIETIRPLFQKVQQLDRDLGAGFLLRHFSRWLVVLTTGDVDTLTIDDIVLDNVAVTTIDNIHGQRADISAVPYVASILRSDHVTFLYPIRYSSKDILYKTTGSRVDWAVLLSCFKWQVYLCLSVILVGVTTFFLMFKRVSVRQTGRRKVDDCQTLETIMSTIGVTCSQGSSTLSTTESNRILLAFWWLTCIPITSVYSGNLVAILTVSKENVPFTGLDGLLDSGYDVGIETGSYIAEIFSGSNDSVNKQIWKKTREHQRDNLTIEQDRMYHRSRLNEGRYAFITDRDIIHSYMMETCDMAHTKKNMFQSASSLIVPKHSPLALLLDPELMALWERGIIDKWYKQTTREENVCSSKEEDDNGLKLRDLLTVLAAAGVGVSQ